MKTQQYGQANHQIGITRKIKKKLRRIAVNGRQYRQRRVLHGIVKNRVHQLFGQRADQKPFFGNAQQNQAHR